MRAYDAVAREYAAVFDDIRLRRREWPWLRRRVMDRRPESALDIGCGNGYLSAALAGKIPRLFAVEPCEALFQIAREKLDGGAETRLAAAENLPFPNNDFDMVISLLSFRYTQWDAALPEIYRVLKPGGVFILIDLFAAAFRFRFLPAYAAEWFGARLWHFTHREYYKKLRALNRAAAWREMVRRNPKRSFEEARGEIEKRFFIEEKTVLSRARSGKTVGLICRKN